MLNPKEEGKFKDLMIYLHEHDKDCVYKMIFADGTVINAKYDTDYDYDNELPNSDPNYEDFYMIVCLNLETNELFEFHYADMPTEVWHGDIRVI